jgi:hypothetical protein
MGSQYVGGLGRLTNHDAHVLLLGVVQASEVYHGTTQALLLGTVRSEVLLQAHRNMA